MTFIGDSFVNSEGLVIADDVSEWIGVSNGVSQEAILCLLLFKCF